jgi:hypothetical protein
MMNTNHPDDEVLAAFAGADPDVTGDPAASQHVASCDRCAATVADLRSLSMALGELPDLAPHRPLRFLPPVAEPRPSLADRLGVLVRGIFAPALTAGAALVLVGTVGTFGPSMAGSQAGDGGAAPQNEAAIEAQESAQSDMAAPGAQSRAEASPTAEGAAEDGLSAGAPSEQPTVLEAQPSAAALNGLDRTATTSGDAGDETAGAGQTDRPIWPMVLFSGVALIVLMLMLRWIFAPRAG